MEERVGGGVIGKCIDGDCQKGGERECQAEGNEGERPSGEMREEVNACGEKKGRECDTVEDSEGDK